MPLIKSPGQLLKLWKKGTADFLKANKLKELEPQEDFLNKKAIKGLERLRIAAGKKESTDPDEFVEMRDDIVLSMEKLQKLFKPKKDKTPSTRKYFLGLGRMTLVTEKFELKDLDANEEEPNGDLLDDVDPAALEQRPEREGGAPKKQARPESPEEEKIKAQLKALMPAVREVTGASTSVTDEVKQRLAGINDCLLHNDYNKAGEHLGALPALLKTGLGEIKEFEEKLKDPNERKKVGDTLDQEDEKERDRRVQEYVKTAKHEKQNFLDKKGSYQLTGKNAQGGEGTVHFLKSNDPDAPSVVVKTGNTEKNQDNLENELAFYEKIGEHPNIARVYGIDQVGGKNGLVMESITGGDMSETIGQMNKMVENGSISEEDYWGIMQFTISRTLETLDFINKKGLIHHDIKAPNIMIDEETGEPKIIDFGMSTETGEGARGTMGLAPYDGTQKGATGKSDTFSTGAMGYEVRGGNTGLTANKAFDYNGLGLDKFIPKEQLEKKLMEEGTGEGFGGWGKPKVKQVKTELTDEDKEKLKKLEALGVSEDPNEVLDEEGKKKKGMYARKTAYVDFINRLMDPDPTKRPSLTEALNHPFLRDRMLDDEGARDRLKGVVGQRKNPAPERSEVQVRVTPGFTAAAFEKTMADAVAAGAVPEASGLVTAIAEGLRTLQPQLTQARTLSRETQWDAKREACENALGTIEDLQKSLGQLLAKEPYQKHETIKGYLEGLQASGQQEQSGVQAIISLGAPTITAAKFHDAWSALKAKADTDFRAASRACLTRINQASHNENNPRQFIKDELSKAGLDKAKNLDEYFSFKENFGGALDDFEKVMKKNKKADTDKARTKVLGIAEQYVKNIGRKSFEELEPHRAALRLGLNDLIFSINQAGGG